MLKKTITLLICLFICELACGQADEAVARTSFLQYDIQINKTRLQDDILSQLNYGGIGLSQSLTYQSINQKTAHLASINYENAKLSNNSNVNSIDAQAASLIYKYRKDLKKKLPFDSNLYLGAYLKGKGFARDKRIFIDNFSYSKNTGEWFVSTGLSVLLDKQFSDNHRFMAEFDIALLSYLTGANEVVGIQFADKLFDYNFGLNYEFSSKNNFSFLAGYNFYLHNYAQKTVRIKYANHSLLLGLRFNLIKQ